MTMWEKNLTELGTISRKVKWGFTKTICGSIAYDTASGGFCFIPLIVREFFWIRRMFTQSDGEPTWRSSWTTTSILRKWTILAIWTERKFARSVFQVREMPSRRNHPLRFTPHSRAGKSSTTDLPKKILQQQDLAH